MMTFFMPNSHFHSASLLRQVFFNHLDSCLAQCSLPLWVDFSVALIDIHWFVSDGLAAKEETTRVVTGRRSVG